MFRRGFREVFVGSESAGDYFNIQKSWCMAWWFFVFVMFCFWVLLNGCVDCLLWLFVWLILRLIDEMVFRICYVLFWAFYWLSGSGIVCRDCLMWLIVPIGCFLLNVCDFVRKKKNKGLTVHCNIAFVKPYVKMSVFRFKRLIFWFGRVLFVVKMLLCSERRFANDEKVKSFAK